ncbi:transmembrane protein [Cyclospora cayetanensis]|uniref:Transmembrane protein n=1 Tax=Cyclospora cayetanensis TaxID=88456 RepID=A0A1D3CYL4_9EIME|nr:transmembrane protein [Cyclospora cayetanensis]
MFSAVVAEMPVALEVSIVKVFLPSGDEAPLWLSEGLSLVRLRPLVPPLSALFPGLDPRHLLRELQVGTVSVHLDAAQADRFTITANVQATAICPFGAVVPLAVRGAAFELQLLGGDGLEIGSVTSTTPAAAEAAEAPEITTQLEVQPGGEETLLVISMRTEAVIELAGGGAPLGRWIREALHGSGSLEPFLARGSAAVVLDVGGFSQLLVRGLQIDSSFSFGSEASADASSVMVAADTPDAAVGPVSSEGGKKGGLAFEGEASFSMPVPVRMLLPPLHLKARYGSTLIAELETESISLQPRPSRTAARFSGTLLQQTTSEGLQDLNALAAETVKGLILGEAASEIAGGGAASPQQKQLGPVLQIEATVQSSQSSASAPRWLLDAIQGTILEAPVMGSQLLSPTTVREVQLRDTEIDATGSGVSGSLSVTSRVSLVLEAFFGEGAPLVVEGLRVEAAILDPKSGVALAVVKSVHSMAGAARVKDGDVALDPPATIRALPNGLLSADLSMKLLMDVLDEEAFADFAVTAIQGTAATQILLEGTVSINLQTPLGLLSLEGLHVRQSVPIDGLSATVGALTDDSLRVLSFSVEDVTLDGSGGRDSLSFVVDVIVGKNASPGGSDDMQIRTGALSFSLVDATDGRIVGEGSVPAAVLGGGDSHPMRISGMLYAPSEDRRRGKSRLATFMSKAINGEPLGVYVHWRDDPSNPRPSWMGRVVDSLHLNPSIAGLETSLSLLESLGFRGLRINTETPDAVGVSALVDVTLRSPLGSQVPLHLDKVSGIVELFGLEGEGSPMAALAMESRSPLAQVQEGDVLHVTLQLDQTRDSLRLSDEGRAFADFVSHQINVGPSLLMYKARVSAVVQSPFGILAVSDFEVKGHSSLLEGGSVDANGSALSDIEFTVDGIEFEPPPDGRKALGFSVSVELRIPLDLSMHLGPVAFQLLFDATAADLVGDATQEGEDPATSQSLREELLLSPGVVSLGVLEVPELKLQGGEARLTARGYIQPAQEDLPYVSAFISRLLSSASPDVVLKGLSASLPGGQPAPEWLQSAVRGIIVSAPLPPVSSLVASTFSDLRLENMRLKALPAGEGESGVQLGATIETTVKNPLGEGSPINIKRIEENGGGSPARRLQERPLTTSSSGEAFALASRRLIGRLVVQEKAVQQRGSVVAIEVSETLAFTDSGEAFSSLALEMMQHTTAIRVGVLGTASVQLESIIGELHLHGVPLHSVVSIQGLGLFQADTLRALANSVGAGALTSPRLPRALALETVVQMPASKVAVDLSSLVFTVGFEGEALAAVVVPSMQLKGGGGDGELVGLTGVVKPTSNASFSRLASSFFKGSSYAVQIVGAPEAFEASASSTHGLALTFSGMRSTAMPPLWVRRVLAGVSFEVPVARAVEGGPSQAQNLMREVQVLGVDVDMSGSRNPFVEVDFVASYTFPPQFNVRHKVQSMEGELLLHTPGSTEPVAQLVVKDLVVLGQEPSAADSRLHVELRPTELVVFSGREKTFSQLVQDTVNSSDSLSVDVMGDIRVSVETAVGLLTVAMPVQVTQTIQGLGGLSGSSVSSFFELSEMTVVGADTEFLDAMAKLRLQMPGDDCILGVNLGPIILDVDLPIPADEVSLLEDLDEEFRKHNVVKSDSLGPLVTTGLVKLPRLMIPSPAKRRKQLQQMKEQGLTGELPADTVAAFLFPPVKIEGLELRMGTPQLMSNYLNGVPTTLVVKSNASTTKNELLIPFFDTFRVETVIQGTDRAFIKEVLISVKLRNFQPAFEAIAVFENPTGATVKFKFAKLETFYNGRCVKPVASRCGCLSGVASESEGWGARDRDREGGLLQEDESVASSLGPMVIDKRAHPDIIEPNKISKSSPVPVQPQLKGGTFALVHNILKRLATNSTEKPTVQSVSLLPPPSPAASRGEVCCRSPLDHLVAQERKEGDKCRGGREGESC